MNEGNRLPALPAWPIYALFVGYPLWWALGLGAFAVPLAAVPMVAFMMLRGGIRAPGSFWLWAAFLLFVLGSFLQIDTFPRALGYMVRLGNYLGATAVFLYLFNARERLPRYRVLWSVFAFWLFVIFGGLLGVVAPNGSLHTVVGSVLPKSIMSNDYVEVLVNPNFAEVQTPWDSPVSFNRPSAPFPYTNGWGCTAALLVMFALATWAVSKTRGQRILVATSIAVAVIPAAATLNRGMYLAVAAGLVYGAFRMMLKGRPGPLVGLICAGALVVAVGLMLQVNDLVEARITYSSTTADRLLIYREAFSRTLASPVLGYGAPRPSVNLPISVGTQGQVWGVLFSNGFIALGCFVAWLLVVSWQTRRFSTMSSLWLHVTLVVASLEMIYYGFDGPQLVIIMAAVALRLRDPDRVRREVVPAPSPPQLVSA